MIDLATNRITLTVQPDQLQALARPAAYRLSQVNDRVPSLVMLPLAS
jgi:hypothetical protein